MRRFRLPNKSLITESSLTELYRRVRRLTSDTGETSLLRLVQEALGSFREFFVRLGKPSFQHTPIDSDDTPDALSFRDMVRRITSDVRMGYDESSALRQMTVASYNYGTVRSAELQRRADKLGGLVGDLRLLSGQGVGEVLVFSDNFVDASKIDQAFPLEHTPAEIAPGQGTLMLNRSGSFSVPASSVRVDVTAISPVGLSRKPTRDNTTRLYEGHFHTYLGQAEPEGGVFHFEEALDDASLSKFTQASMAVPDAGDDDKFSRNELRDFVVPGGFEAKFLEQVQSGIFADKKGKELQRFINRRRQELHRRDRALRRSYLYYSQHPEANVKLPSSNAPVTPENLIAVDAGASDSELQDSRSKMFDGNPDSYWQCELALETNVLQDHVESQTQENQLTQISAAELRDLAASEKVDVADFEIELLFTLREPVILNWVTLQPMHFDDGIFLEVTDVSTASDLESSFTVVESFVDRSGPTVLTEEANEEISADRASYVLAPNRYSYRGFGVWPFAAREVRLVRVRLRQKTPVPSPYEKFVLETTRSVKTGRRRN